jgi:hypothetical protein
MKQIFLLIIALFLTAWFSYAMANRPSEDSTTSNEVVNNTENTSASALKGGVVPGNPQKASETGNSDPTRNSETLPAKPAGGI